MMLMIFLALLNGCCITLCRILNGQLAHQKTPFKASFVNHLGGFLFLSLLFIVFSQQMEALPDDPILYLGGVIGALYVAVNSYVMVHLGSTNAIIMVITGQMLFGLVIELWLSGTQNLTQQLLGVGFIILGIYLKERVVIKK